MELCVALDLSTKEENLELAEKLKGYNIWLKVGFRSYIRDGKEFLQELKAISSNFKIFLDLKLYDIPNTMADAAEEIADLGVDMFNVHASAGEKAMELVMSRLSKYEIRPLVIAVTALTSFKENEFKKIYTESILEKAVDFAVDAYNAGLDGVVSSVFESRIIKNHAADGFKTICPGIRPFGESAGDQARVADLPTAKNELADFIVVGRPIYNADNPAKVVEKILAEIK